MHDIIKMTGLTLFLGCAETAAITFITKYSRQSSFVFMVIAILVYGLVVPYGIYRTLDYSNIATINLLWNVLTTVSVILVSYFYFGDKLTNLHLISLFLGIASISVLYLAEK
jgi:multidrug transporter EmrE-like cation transporter